MRIDGRGPTETRDIGATESVGTAKARARDEAVARPEADRVELSPGAELFALAKKTIDDSPEVRQDVVDRMKAALAAGEIGQDAEHIADKMIDHLLDS